MTKIPNLDRRSLLAVGALAAAAPVMAHAASKRPAPAFPKGFLWGAATAPHQIEGNNVSSDLWFVENQKPTVFAEPSGDAVNSLELWATDLDIVKSLALTSYRFGVEWARIEPEKGLFSQAMLDHYKRIVEGCHARGLAPLVTFNHFTAPLWFSAQGGWTNPESAQLFARYCDKVARAIGADIAMAMTLNEPNILLILKNILPPPVWDMQRQTLAAATKRLGVERFLCANVAGREDVDAIVAGQMAGHKAARAAIKAVRGDLPVGFTLSVLDDQAAGKNSLRDKVRAELYGGWLEIAKGDDFIGVQNYERAVWNDKGRLPAPDGADRNWSGTEVWAPSLAGAVRYVHAATKVPVLVSEHGVGTEDDTLRARFIPAALEGLKQAMDDGVPVLGYMHWSLLDNYEWIFGYKPHFGLCSVDRTTFARTPKPSASVLGGIAKRNSL
ncbi:family 1 glycosylhydrolase [Novosphingobium sp. ST904]|uniref:family 1 glycosylhydrolase n=1 Tax=Novosphingobium sp. ST904 TaxID=1684385 RepID=UPI0006C89BC2|nr:family 1 glycosylhydrolase [Novosphingobium sp. ST904]KPH59847.1 beta-glucosidase [Novosphingobium sp. ST904]TCM39809.1 beta-glucosidase [Novosphingobium sp. ST904]